MEVCYGSDQGKSTAILEVADARVGNAAPVSSALHAASWRVEEADLRFRGPGLARAAAEHCMAEPVNGLTLPQWPAFAGPNITRMPEMTTANEAFRRAANSPAGRHAQQTAKDVGETVRSAAHSAKDTAEEIGGSIGDQVSEFASGAAQKAGDFASDVSRRAGKQYGRARDAAVDAYDEVHERAAENPHITFALGLGLGFLVGIVLARR